MVSPADSTLAAIRKKVRRLTSSPSESALTNKALDEYINTFYTQDFAYAIHIDQQRVVFDFYTEPNIDTYPLDTNKYQSIRDPIYFEGVEGKFYKDRNQFFNVWPRYPSKETLGTGDGATVLFNYTSSAKPFLRNNVVIGSVDTGGNTIRITDDGTGGWVLQTPDGNGNYTETAVTGSVNYVTGVITITFPTAPASNQEITLWVASYEAGRPYQLLFWNNEFTVRPVPDNVYKVEVKAYQTPTEFMATTQSPTLNQWWQYIALGAALKVLEDRQDIEGYQSLEPMFYKQEALVLERQANEEIGQANGTIYNSSLQPAPWGSPQGWW